MNLINHKRRRWLSAGLALLVTRPASLLAIFAGGTSTRVAAVETVSAAFAKAFEPVQRRLSARWIEQGWRYVEGVNRYHAAMDAHFTAVDAGKKSVKPADVKSDPRNGVSAEILKVAKALLPSATAAEIAQWRAAFPFAYDALIDAYKNDSCAVDQCFSLDGNDCAVIVKNFNGHPRSLGVKRGATWKFDATVHRVGRSNNRKIWAFANERGIETRDGFDGKVINTFAYPRGNEGLPDWLKLQPTKAARVADVVLPFNDGARVLLANETGVYLLTAATKDKALRLHPQEFDREGAYSWPKNKDEAGRALSLAMVHVALSPDEKYIALGEQDSAHLLLNSAGKVVASADPGNYPHYALFDRAATQVLFNECHFYNGTTGMLALNKVASSAAKTPVTHTLKPVDEVLRVYSATAGPDAFYLGGSGYMNCVELGGRQRWRHHVGGSVNAVEFTNDDKFLWTASYSGLLVRSEARAGTGDPARIGDSPLWDVERWLFLDDMSAPIPW
jgi:hypothetical protein